MIGGASLAGAVDSFQSAMTEILLRVSEGSIVVDYPQLRKSLGSRPVEAAAPAPT